MSMGGSLIFWITGGILAAAGLLLLYRGVFADRSRGRRRCPKCWYDMSHTEGLVCSECGREVKRERRLHRTRRHRRVAALGLLLLLLGEVGLAWPTILNTGWQQYAPTTVLLIAAPYEDDPTAPVIKELTVRLWGTSDSWELMLARREEGAGRLPGWQQRLMAHSCARILAGNKPRESRRFAFDALEANPKCAKAAMQELIASLQSEDAWRACSVIRRMGPEAEAAVPALISILEQGQTGQPRNILSVEGPVIWALGAIGPAAAPATNLLVKELAGQDARSAAEALGQIGPDAVAALPALVQACDTDDPRLRAAVAGGIAGIGPSTPDAKRLLVTLLGEKNVAVREAAAQGILKDPALRTDLVQKLAAQLAGDEVGARVEAARALLALAPSVNEALPQLREALQDEQAVVRAFAATVLSRVEPASGDLQPLLADEDEFVRFTVRHAVSMSAEKEVRP